MIKNILIIALVLLSPNTSGSQTNVTYVCPPCYSQCDTLKFKQKGECKHCGMKLIPKKDVKKLESDSNKKRIAFYLQDGVEVLDFAGPLEVFSYAGHDISIISKTTKPIVSQGVLSIVPDYDIKNVPQVDVLVFFLEEMIVDNTKKGLYTLFENHKTPLFHEKDDLFSKMNQATVTFIRNESNQVVSMKSNEHKDSFFKQ